MWVEDDDPSIGAESTNVSSTITSDQSIIQTLFNKVQSKRQESEINLPNWPQLKIGAHSLFELPSPQKLLN